MNCLYKSSTYKGPSIVGIAANLLSLDFAEVIANSVRDIFEGKLHIVVNSAAVTGFRNLGELEVKYINDMVVGNIQSLILLMKLLINRQYIQPLSRVVNISGAAAR